jgi:hypothetical protein
MAKTFRYAITGLILVSGLSSCGTPPPPLPARFSAAPYVTLAEVGLRAAPSDAAPTISLLPPTTPLLFLESGPGEWKVDTPSGIGWLYTGYIAPRT